VASKRRNPKKNKAARRRRPDRPGLHRARLEIEDIHHLMAAAPPAALPLVGLTSLWLWNLAEDQAAAAHCVDGCLTLHYALAEFGIRSHVEAITICIERAAAGSAPGAMYGQHPHYNADGTFNGHTILVVTGAGRFIDPTIQQFREVPHSKQAMPPLQAPLPVPGGMGTSPIGIPRADHLVMYLPLPEHLRQAWRGPAVQARSADYRKAGANLAANTLAMLQIEDMRRKAEQSPYPRLRALLAALDGTKPVADRHGFRFADPVTGKEI
jgi:hypothetical protein